MTFTAEIHDDYIAAWNRATATGSTAELESFIADDYHGWSGEDALTARPFTTSDAWEGFTQATEALAGTSVHAAHRTVGRRGDRDAVVFYELSYRRREDVIARAALLECWRRDTTPESGSSTGT